MSSSLSTDPPAAKRSSTSPDSDRLRKSRPMPSATESDTVRLYGGCFIAALRSSSWATSL